MSSRTRSSSPGAPTPLAHPASRVAPLSPARAAASWDNTLADAGPGASEGWERWRAHLANRRTPRPLRDLAAEDAVSPLSWSVPERCGEAVVRWLEEASRLPRAADRAARAYAAAIEQELAAPQTGEDAARFALTRLAWAHALPFLARVMEPAAWRKVLENLQAAVDDGAALSPEQDTLAWQLLRGELPWTLAYWFPELESCRRGAALAGATLSKGLEDLLDGEGLIASQYVPLLRPLLALWTRCGLLSQAANQDCYTREARIQYAWLVQRAILLSRPDGGQLLSPGVEGRWRPGLFTAALAVADDPDDEHLAHEVLPLPAKKRGAAPRGPAPQYAFHSEWAEAGLLRTAATREAPRLFATYGQRQLRAELTNRSQVVFSGVWDPQIDVNGQRLAPEGDWEEVCWVSDADVDYLEVEMSLSSGWRVQRQMLLARKDDFLFVADAVLGASPGQVQYRCVAPLAPGVSFAPEGETRDGMIQGRKKLAVVLPLALPEWRSDRRSGALEANAEGLALTLQCEGAALYAPWFFDLSRPRMKKERTWRRLTVAERLVIQPSEVAVGFRVQVDRQQWMFYRSLTKAANRTVLGQNLNSEFVAARFLPTGYLEELISVSSEG